MWTCSGCSPPETSRIHVSAIRKVRKIAPRKFFACFIWMSFFFFLWCYEGFTTRGSLGLKWGSGCSRTGAWRRCPEQSCGWQWTPELQQKLTVETGLRVRTRPSSQSSKTLQHRSDAFYSPAQFTVIYLCSFNVIHTRKTRVEVEAAAWSLPPQKVVYVGDVQAGRKKERWFRSREANCFVFDDVCWRFKVVTEERWNRELGESDHPRISSWILWLFIALKFKTRLFETSWLFSVVTVLQDNVVITNNNNMLIVLVWVFWHLFLWRFNFKKLN